MQHKPSNTTANPQGSRASLDERIDSAIRATTPGTRARTKALASVKWRLRYGLLCAGLDTSTIGARCVLVSPDDKRVQVFDGRDNENQKAAYYGAVLGYKFEVELCAS